MVFLSGVVVNNLDILRKNGKTWLESITKATMVDPGGAMKVYEAISALLDTALGPDAGRDARAYTAALDDLR